MARSAGLCDAAKGRAVLNWIGWEKIALPGEDWLVSLQRRLYLKHVAGDGGLPEVKAYLSFQGQYAIF